VNFTVNFDDKVQRLADEVANVPVDYLLWQELVLPSLLPFLQPVPEQCFCSGHVVS
jgi:hypothetical protein